MYIHSAYYYCRWPAEARSQGIGTHGIDLLLLEKSGLGTGWFKPFITFSFNPVLCFMLSFIHAQYMYWSNYKHRYFDLYLELTKLSSFIEFMSQLIKPTLLSVSAKSRFRFRHRCAACLFCSRRRSCRSRSTPCQGENRISISPEQCNTKCNIKS